MLHDICIIQERRQSPIPPPTEVGGLLGETYMKRDPNDTATWTWDELVNFAAQEVHSRLLQEGGKGLKSGTWLAMDLALRWHQARRDEEAEASRRKGKGPR